MDETYVCGLATDYCVKYTCMDAVSLGLRTWVVTDGTLGVNVSPYDVDKTFTEMTGVGVGMIESRSVLSS